MGGTTGVPVLMSSTQTRLGASPTQISLLSTVNTPSGPDVSLLPVKPVKPGLKLFTTVFVTVSTTMTSLPVRLAM
jgi:hypothetical protein